MRFVVVILNMKVLKPLMKITNRRSSNGRTTDSESVYLGSNPSHRILFCLLIDQELILIDSLVYTP